jgi:Cu-Zn family superoxide dismutase
MKIGISLTIFALAFGVHSFGVCAEDHPQATIAMAKLIDADKKQVGEAHLQQTPTGILIQLSLSHIAPGTHAFHIHQVGKCDVPDFKSAGGHFNPFEEEHGILNKDGQHAGDLPNIHVPESGTLTVEALTTHITLNQGKNQVLDPDGAALVIHSSSDDYRTNPAGDAGQRIACGVITAASTGTTSEPVQH